MNLSQSFGVDQEKATKGIWRNLSGCKFLLSYHHRSKVTNYFQSQFNKFRMSIDAEDALVMAQRATLVRHIILDWEEVEVEFEVGKPEKVEYSPENATKLLNFLDGLDSMLIFESSKIELYRMELKQKTKEN